jgi:hypothetical protein
MSDNFLFIYYIKLGDRNAFELRLELAQLYVSSYDMERGVLLLKNLMEGFIPYGKKQNVVAALAKVS